MMGIFSNIKSAILLAFILTDTAVFGLTATSHKPALKTRKSEKIFPHL